MQGIFYTKKMNYNRVRRAGIEIISISNKAVAAEIGRANIEKEI